MRILWVGKAPAGGDAGDEVFDRKTISALRAKGHTVVTLHARQVAKWRELANLLRGTPHYRARFDSRANRRLSRQAGAGCDVTVCSWEPLDVLVPHLPRPVIVIAHNVTSLALPRLFPNSRWAKFAAGRAKSWERRLYRRNAVAAVAALSHKDRDYFAGLADAPDTLLVVPGMPSVIPLAPGAELRQELVLLGTYDWLPKRRDVILFMQEYARLQKRLPIFAGALPAEAAAAVMIGSPLQERDYGAAIRFGLITDRFEAGHKLKTLAYIAQNQLVLSFTDVHADFAQIPDHAFFLRTIGSTAEIDLHVAEVAALDANTLRTRFLEFQRECAMRFTWNAVADRLLDAAGQASRLSRTPP